MIRELPWISVPAGSVVLGKDGYEWDVRGVGRADPDAPAGSVKVTMYREGRGEVTGQPPAGTKVKVLSMPGSISESEAVDRLRRVLGVEVVECGWCSGDTTAECVCDVNCGREGCVNF